MSFRHVFSSKNRGPASYRIETANRPTLFSITEPSYNAIKRRQQADKMESLRRGRGLCAGCAAFIPGQ